MSYLIVGNRNLARLLDDKVQTHPDKVFLLFEDSNERVTSFSYGQFDRSVNQVTNALRENGVGRGDRVLLHLTNRPEFLFFWFATAKLGAIMVPTNPLSPAQELSYPLGHSEPGLAVTQPDLLDALQGACSGCPSLRRIVVCGTGSPLSEQKEIVSFDEFVTGQSSEASPADIGPDEDAAILYTSGTTSRPKGVLVTHANYVYLGETVSSTMKLGPDDRQFVTMPLFHGNAQYYSFTTALTVGASTALMHRFSASRFMLQAARHECTVTSLFAAPIRMILAQPPRETDDAHQLRLVIFAQNVTQSQLEAWENRFKAPLLQIYGMTETMGQPLANSLNFRRDNMTIGMVTLGYECKVVNDAGEDVASGKEGQLLVRGRPGWTILKGYYRDPKTTAAAIRNGWLWTGDVVRVNENGFFVFVGRAKDIIKRAGENVSANEVEAVLKQHPAVADAAVVGVPDSVRDEAIKAFVILKPGESATDLEIIEFCRDRLAKFKVPEWVEFRGSFPLTSVGKIQKHLL